jgi:hypothetical protein
MSEMPKIAKRCIGACYPPDTIFYNPITLQAIKNNYASCPIFPEDNDWQQLSRSCNNPNTKENAPTIELFENFPYASNANMFLQQIYDISNLDEMNLFFKNEMDILPLLTRKRIIKASYEEYRRDREFPTKEFIEQLHKTMNKRGDTNISLTKLAKKVMKAKDDENVVDIYKIFGSSKNFGNL